MRAETASGSLAVALVLASLAQGACTPAPEAEPMPQADTTEANLNAIRALVGTFVQSMNEEQIEEFVDLFTEDAVRMPPNAPAIVGINAIRTNAADTFFDNEVEVQVQVEESRFSGDLGVVSGTFSLRLQPEAGGQVAEDVGSWLNLVERQPNGSWKISRSIWNSDRPLDG